MHKKANILSLENDPDVAKFIHGSAKLPIPPPAQPLPPEPATPNTPSEATASPDEPGASVPPGRRPRASKSAAQGKNSSVGAAVSHVTFNVDSDLHLRLKLHAVRTGRPLYDLVQDALRRYLKAQGAE